MHIVIPAYNEELRLPRTLRALRRFVAERAFLGDVEVLVVDNGSTDGTAEVARAASTPGLQRGADVVIGSRALTDSVADVRSCRTRAAGAAAYRRIAGRLLPGIADTQCGFKVMRGAFARAVAAELTARGFSFDVELLVRLRAAGARIDEIAVTWTDVPGSTFVPARHGAGAFTELAAIAWRTRHLGAPVAGRVTARPGTGSPMPRPAAVALPVAIAVPAAAALLSEA